MEIKDILLIIIAIVAVILFVHFFLIIYPKIMKLFKNNELPSSITDINNNPDNYENKLVKVNGLFYAFTVYGLNDNNCHHIGFAAYKLVNSQGFQLFIYAPNGDLSQYNGQTITVQGVIKSTYDSGFDNTTAKVTCNKSGYYLEFSGISDE